MLCVWSLLNGLSTIGIGFSVCVYVCVCMQTCMLNWSTDVFVLSAGWMKRSDVVSAVYGLFFFHHMLEKCPNENGFGKYFLNKSGDSSTWCFLNMD